MVVSAGVASLSSVLVVPLFVAVHRSLLSVFVRVRRALLSRFPSLAWRLVMGDVDGGVVASVGQACVQSWPMVGVGCFRRRWLSFAGSLCPLRVLLPWLGGCGVMLGGRSRSWTPGAVGPSGGYRTLHESDVVARRMQVVVVRCVEVVGGVVGVVAAR